MILYKIQDSILMSPAKRDRIILVNLILSIVINIAIWVALIFTFRQQSEDYIVLGYNIYFGISSFGPWYNSMLIPFLGLVVIVVNFNSSFYLYLKEKMLSYFLAITALIFNLLLFLSVLVLIYVNI